MEAQKDCGTEGLWQILIWLGDAQVDVCNRCACATECLELGDETNVGMATTGSSEVTIVDTARLAHLLENLKPALPRSNAMHTCVKNVMEGRVEGTFYTDGWPLFTTVVFQCLRPRFSDVADLSCYTTSKERLLYVLQKAQLIDFHNWQMIQVHVLQDEDTVGFLVDNLHQVGLSDYVVVDLGDYVLLNSIDPCISCAKGYSIGELTADHNDFVSSQGQWFNFIGRDASYIRQYHKECIERFDTVAAFCDGDTTLPVAWQIRWPLNGSTGNLYTVEGHRRKGLGLLVKAEMCKKIQAQGDIPECQIRPGNHSNIKLAQKMGFVKIGTVNYILLKFNTGCDRLKL